MSDADAAAAAAAEAGAPAAEADPVQNAQPVRALFRSERTLYFTALALVLILC